MLNKKYVFDVVIPNNNEEKFIDMALNLGHTTIVLLTDNINYSYNNKNSPKIKIKTAYLIKDCSEISRARKKFDYIFAVAQRKYFESKVDYIIYSEESNRKDSFHYRSTSLNQVHAQLSKDNNLNIVINFGILLNDTKNITTNLGRIIQNSKLIKKYKLNYSIFSLTLNPELMRSKTTLQSLEKVLKL
jgi:hypothetical protein